MNCVYIVCFSFISSPEFALFYKGKGVLDVMCVFCLARAFCVVFCPADATCVCCHGVFVTAAMICGTTDRAVMTVSRTASTMTAMTVFLNFVFK